MFGTLRILGLILLLLFGLKPAEGSFTRAWTDAIVTNAVLRWYDAAGYQTRLTTTASPLERDILQNPSLSPTSTGSERRLEFDYDYLGRRIVSIDEQEMAMGRVPVRLFQPFRATWNTGFTPLGRLGTSALGSGTNYLYSSQEVSPFADPARNRFMPPSWKKANPLLNPFQRMLNRFPEFPLGLGSAATGAYAASHTDGGL